MLLVATVMLQLFSRVYLEAVDQAHLGMSDTVAGSLRSRRWGDTPSMKRHGHPFPVTGDALKGACFLPILGWCHHDDSHFLRALGTKQRPGVSKDCLVRHILVHRHDEFPSRREVKNILIEVIPLVSKGHSLGAGAIMRATATSGVKAAQRPKGLALTPAQGGEHDEVKPSDYRVKAG